MPSLLQGYVFMALAYSGIIFGLIFQIKTFLTNLFNNKIINFMLDLIFALIGGGIFWIALFKSNLGIFRIFLLLSFLLGFIIINFSIGELVAKFGKVLYNILNRKIEGKNEKEKAN